MIAETGKGPCLLWRGPFPYQSMNALGLAPGITGLEIASDFSITFKRTYTAGNTFDVFTDYKYNSIRGSGSPTFELYNSSVVIAHLQKSKATYIDAALTITDSASNISGRWDAFHASGYRVNGATLIDHDMVFPDAQKLIYDVYSVNPFQFPYLDTSFYSDRTEVTMHFVSASSESTKCSKTLNIWWSIYGILFI